MLNLAQVQAFLAVVDSGGFGDAARRLGLAQPTVSLQVRKLEEDLGVRLLARSNARTLPSVEGRLFLPHARGLIRAAERARVSVGVGPLAVGASGNIGTYLLPRRVKNFADAEPGREVQLVIGSNPETAERLEAGLVDVAVMEWWDGRPGFVATIWREEPLVVIVPPDHPWATRDAIARADMFGVPLIGGEPGTGTGRLLERTFGRDAGRLKVGPTLGSTAAVKEAVKAGLGVSLVMAAAVTDEVRLGTLRALPLIDAHLVKPLSIVRREDQPETAPAARFAAFLAGGDAVPAG